jgi:hypothetical protein
MVDFELRYQDKEGNNIELEVYNDSAYLYTNGEETSYCQSALKIDPPSASKIDPPQVVVFSY